MKNLKIVFVLLVTIASISIATAQETKQKYGCTAEVPSNAVYIQDTTNARGLADNYYLWDNGKTIYIKFLSGSKAMQDKVKSIVKEWERYANLKFEFVTVGASNIRINLDNKGGHNSMVGTLANNVGEDERTMNFDTTDFKTFAAMRRTVLHEFGHAIGLLHEHYSPVSGIPWNKEAVYADLKKTQGWDKAMVDVNLFQQYKVSYTNGTEYDKLSIMHYPVFARWTTNGFSVDWNNDLSEGDKNLIGLLYPKDGNRTNEVPRFTVSNFTSITVSKNDNKQGVSIYPSFKMTTAGKSARVYFIAFFYDEEGNPIKKETDTYNINNIAATFKSSVLGVGKSMAANKTKNNDFELFIPYDQLPVNTGKNNFQVEFRVYLQDDKEMKILYQSKRKVFSFMKS
ncbi:MAG TPA: M12 family metallopeptidase [Chitinophagaceae bacterium]|nr:M12 family metallopeptidase [Chitinophagaceae bacterium]